MRPLYRLLLVALAALAMSPLVLPVGRWMGMGSQPWPRNTITYYDATTSQATGLAARQWNRADVGVTLKQVADRDAADVVVRESTREVSDWCKANKPSRASKSCRAYASTIGYPGSKGSEVIAERPGRLDQVSPGPAEVRLMVHEFGHILGLTHDTEHGCQVMYPGITLPRCYRKRGRDSDRLVMCGPFPQDVKRVAAMYGGRGRDTTWCPRTGYLAGTDYELTAELDIDPPTKMTARQRELLDRAMQAAEQVREMNKAARGVRPREDMSSPIEAAR